MELLPLGQMPYCDDQLILIENLTVALFLSQIEEWKVNPNNCCHKIFFYHAMDYLVQWRYLILERSCLYLVLILLNYSVLLNSYIFDNQHVIHQHLGRTIQQKHILTFLGITAARKEPKYPNLLRAKRNLAFVYGRYLLL